MLIRVFLVIKLVPIGEPSIRGSSVDQAGRCTVCFVSELSSRLSIPKEVDSFCKLMGTNTNGSHVALHGLTRPYMVYTHLKHVKLNMYTDSLNFINTFE